MLVSPVMIWENIIPILVITVLTLICKPLFSGLGAILAGQPLSDSVKCGMSLSQIGEFSFIIAGLGLSLGVTENFLYPIIVAVSVVTTLTTPFYVKQSDKLAGALAEILPQSLVARINRNENREEGPKKTSLLASYLKQMTLRVTLVVLTALIMVEVFCPLVAPLLGAFIPEPFPEMILVFISLFVTGIFISNLLRRSERGFIVALWAESKKRRFPIQASLVVSLLVSIATVSYILVRVGTVGGLWLFVLAFLITLVVTASRQLQMRFLRLEAFFLGNLNEEILAERQMSLSDEERLAEIKEEFFVVVETLSAEKLVGAGRRSFNELAIAHATNLALFAVIRDGKRVEGAERYGSFGRDARRLRRAGESIIAIEPGDELVFVGTKESVDSYFIGLRSFGFSGEEQPSFQGIEEFLSGPEGAVLGLEVFGVEIERNSPLKGKTVGSLMVDEESRLKVLGVERNHLPIVNPGRAFQILQGDMVWLLGDPKSC